MVKEIPEFMISFNDYRKMRWDVFVLILTIYSCFYIPFEISFQPSINYVIETLDSIIDLIFYIDIIFNMRTTFMTEEGEEITDKKLVARLYIFKGTFIPDLLSVIPLNAMTPVNFKLLYFPLGERKVLGCFGTMQACEIDQDWKNRLKT